MKSRRTTITLAIAVGLAATATLSVPGGAATVKASCPSGTAASDGLCVAKSRTRFAAEHAWSAHARVQRAIESGVRAAAEIHERVLAAPARRQLGSIFSLSWSTLEPPSTAIT